MSAKRETKIIDASGKSLGRLATKIAVLLRGKDQADFAPHKDEGVFVEVKNINEMKITGNKLKGKVYYHHTGRPGGFRETTMEELIAKKGKAEVLRRAVYGMLPKNKLRAQQIKQLLILNS